MRKSSIRHMFLRVSTIFFIRLLELHGLELGGGTTCSLDGCYGRLREGVSLHGEFGFQFTIGQNLNKSLAVDETCGYEFFDTDLLKLLCFGQGLERAEVDGLVLYAVDVLETKTSEDGAGGASDHLRNRSSCCNRSET